MSKNTVETERTNDVTIWRIRVACWILCSVLLTKYHLGDQVKKTEMGRTCGTYGERRGAYRALVGKPEGRRPLERPRRRGADNIKMDLREVGWGAWTGSIWLRIGTGGGLL
jgi:hypothetical protein